MKTEQYKQGRKFRLISYWVASLLAIGSVTSSFATNGTWTSTAGGNWSDPANWSGGTVADGLGGTALFNTLDLTGDIAVTLDTARTNSNLIFADTDTNTPANWTLSGSTLTPGSGTPTITVSNIAPGFSVTIGSIIGVAPNGLTVRGNSRLNLTGVNTFTNLTIDGATVGQSVVQSLGANTISNIVTLTNGATVNRTASITVNQTLKVKGTNTLLLSPSTGGNWNGLFTGDGTLLLSMGGNQLTVGGANAWNSNVWSGFTGTVILDGGGNLRFDINNGSTFTFGSKFATFDLGAANNTMNERNSASIVVHTTYIGALRGGPNTAMAANGATGTTNTLQIGDANLSTTFNGKINNGSITAMTKSGTGTLTLNNTNGYSGVTQIQNGTLALGTNGLIANTITITLANNATFDVSALPPWSPASAVQTLAGNGVVTGTVAVITGTLSPGSPGVVGTLSFSNSVSIDGTSGTTTNLFKLSSGVNDRLNIAGDLALSNSIVLKVVPVGASIPNGIYPLYHWSGNLTGGTNNLILQYPVQPGTFVLSTNLVSKQILLTVSGVAGAANLVWHGDGSLNAWDLTTANWLNGANPSFFNNGDNVTFNDSGSNIVPVDLSLNVNPGSILFNATQSYVLGSSTASTITGSSTLTKTNSGTVTITCDDTSSGLTTVAGGVLEIGDGANASGSLASTVISNNAVLKFRRPDTFTSANAILGPGVVVQGGPGTLTLNGANTYSGGTVISNAAGLTPANASAVGSGAITLAGGTLNGGGLALDNAISITADSTINPTSGQFQLNTGSLTSSGGTLTIAAGGGSLRLNSGAIVYNGAVDLEGTLQIYNTTNSVTFNGIISGAGTLHRRWPAPNPGNGGFVVLNAQNTYSGNTLLREGSIGFGVSSISTTPPTIDSGPIGTGALTQDNATYTAVFAAGGARTVGNPITLNAGGAEFVIAGNNDLTLSGTLDLAAAAKTVEVDNTANSILAGDIFDGSLVKTGNGNLFINGNNTADSTTVIAGALGGTGVFSGPLTVQSGATLAPGAAAIGTLTVNNDLTLGGNVFVRLNKSLVESNDLVTVTGVLTNSGTGTVTVTNIGAPALLVGDSFQLFSQAVGNGAALTITGGGMNWTNKLAIDGSIKALSVISSTANYPTNLSFTFSGGTLTIKWPATHLGWILQNQTNSLSLGLATATNAWHDMPGSDSGTQQVITASPANPTVFYRLRHP